MTREEFIKKARATHGDKYIYDEIPNEVNSKNQVTIICPVHGKFTQNARSHYRQNGCPECGKIAATNAPKYSTEEIIKKINEKFNNKYDTSLVEYINFETPIKLICPIHGEFKKTPHDLMRGKGCPKCGHDNSSLKHKLSREEVIKRANVVHNNKYSYVKYNGEKLSEKVTIICPIHGEFTQTMRKHLMGSGCKKCGYEKLRILQRKPIEELINQCNEVHNNKYKYILDFKYVNNKSYLHSVCPTHGDFMQEINGHLSGYGCPKCVSQVSKWEQKVFDFIQSLNVECEQSNRKVLNGKEIDIFIPKYNIGIECNGLRWHCEKYVDKNYHLWKTNECSKYGIRLIHIFEDEWLFKQDICKSMLKNLFGLIDKKIYARNCKIKEVPFNERVNFLNENHIQGNSQSSIDLGLYYNDELVSLMTFGIPRINLGGKKEEGKYELVRFCNKRDLNVVGGASKLFKHFLKSYQPYEVISYSDKRWSLGNLYNILGFKHDHDSTPNYFYIDGFNRLNRFRFRKSILIKEGYDKDKTEHQIMLERGIYRIYDCGTMVWKWNTC